MKLPITDQFLWDIYKFLQEAGNIADIVFIPRTEYQLKRKWSQKQNLVFEKYNNINKRRYFGDLIYRLKQNNFIKVKNLKNKKAIMLTKKGLNKAIRARFKFEGTNQLKKRKDSKWIMIIFDIPQKHNKARNLLRSVLENLGYKMFQHSVWITPYDVSKKTEELLQYYSLDDYVRIFLIEKIT